MQSNAIASNKSFDVRPDSNAGGRTCQKSSIGGGVRSGDLPAEGEDLLAEQSDVSDHSTRAPGPRNTDVPWPVCFERLTAAREEETGPGASSSVRIHPTRDGLPDGACP